MSVFNYIDGRPSREDKVEEDGSVSRDYMTSLEFKSNSKHQHIKKTFRIPISKEVNNMPITVTTNQKKTYSADALAFASTANDLSKNANMLETLNPVSVRVMEVMAAYGCTFTDNYETEIHKFLDENEMIQCFKLIIDDGVINNIICIADEYGVDTLNDVITLVGKCVNISSAMAFLNLKMPKYIKH
jgi:hypothetical protein